MLDFQTNVMRWGLFCPEPARLLGDVPTNPKLASHESPGEAEVWFQGIQKKNPKMTILFVYGVGSGAHYKAIQSWLRENPIHAVVFFEDDLGVIRHLLESPVGTELIFDPQVWLQYYDEELTTTKELGKLLTNFVMTSKRVVSATSHYKAVKSEIYHRLSKRVEHLLTGLDASTAEYVNGGGHYYRNFFKNLMHLPRAYLGDHFFGQFKGVPAIICGAGPSLEKNADVLRTLTDRALIFAGGTALNALNALDIKAHFGVGIDPNPVHVTRLMMNQEFEIPFFYRSRMNDAALEYVHGDRLFITGGGGHPAPNWFGKKLGLAQQALDEGNNVTNFSLAIAHAMGCNPIICVGIDLAYSESKPYPTGIPRHALHTSSHDFRSKNTEEELLTKKDIYDQPVLTLWKWVIESVWYSHFAHHHPELTLINATEGGIGFGLVPNRTLKEVAAEYLTQEYDFEQMIHEQIQKSALPSVTLPKIKELCLEFKSYLEDSQARCETLLQKLAGKRDELEKGEYVEVVTPDIQELINELQATEGYRQLLSVFDDAYLHVRQRVFFRLLIDKGAYEEKEWALRMANLMHRRYLFLQDTAKLAGGILSRVLDQTIDFAKEETIATQDSLPQSEAGEDVVVRKYPSGTIHSIQRFQNAHREGMQEYFYPNGARKSLIPYSQGKLQGDVQLFHPNGSLFRDIHFEQGKRHGFERRWSEFGMLLIEAKYIDDKPVEYSRQWHPNGNMAKEVLFDEKSAAIKTSLWGLNGNPIAIEKQRDYIDTVNTKTHSLTTSLAAVTGHMQTLMNASSAEGLFAKELADLQSHLQKLQELESEMVYEAGSDPSRPKEAFWKTPAAEEFIQQELAGYTKKMNRQMKTIQEQIQDLTDKFKKPEV